MKTMCTIQEIGFKYSKKETRLNWLIFGTSANEQKIMLRIGSMMNPDFRIHVNDDIFVDLQNRRSQIDKSIIMATISESSLGEIPIPRIGETITTRIEHKVDYGAFCKVSDKDVGFIHTTEFISYNENVFESITPGMLVDVDIGSIEGKRITLFKARPHSETTTQKTTIAKSSGVNNKNKNGQRPWNAIAASPLGPI